MSNPTSLTEYILVAEDSAPNRQILIVLLKRMGFGVIECVDGATAWQAIQEMGDKKIVAIFSDIMMPHMDGLEFLLKVRNEGPNKEIPFVLVTAVSDKEYIIQARQNNVQGYVLKPVTLERIQEKLREIFPDRKFPKLAG